MLLGHVQTSSSETQHWLHGADPDHTLPDAPESRTNGAFMQAVDGAPRAKCIVSDDGTPDRDLDHCRFEFRALPSREVRSLE
jgi:hypothetical protein